MRPATQSLGFQQTSSGWNDESLARCICFLHISEAGRRGRRGCCCCCYCCGWCWWWWWEVAAGLLLICPMRCQHLTNFMQPLKRLPPRAHPCFLRTPHRARSHRRGSMQMSRRPLKVTVGCESRIFRGQSHLIAAFTSTDGRHLLKTSMFCRFRGNCGTAGPYFYPIIIYLIHRLDHMHLSVEPFLHLYLFIMSYNFGKWKSQESK